MAEKAKSPRTTIEKKKSTPARKTGRIATTATAKQRASRRATTKQEIPAPGVEPTTTPTPSARRRPLFQASTWISVLMLAALVGLTFYLNREKEKTPAEDATPTLETTFIFTSADGLVSSIEVKPAEGETVKIARNAENAWAVVLPIEAEADQGMAEAAATQVTALPINPPSIDKDKSPDIFGLDDPVYEITIEFKDGEKRTLEIGDATISGNGYYVRVDKEKMLITDKNGIDALLNLGFFPPYLNTPVPTAEAAATPTP